MEPISIVLLGAGFATAVFMSWAGTLRFDAFSTDPGDPFAGLSSTWSVTQLRLDIELQRSRVRFATESSRKAGSQKWFSKSAKPLAHIALAEELIKEYAD